MNVEVLFLRPTTTSVMTVKSGLSLTDGGESWRVIGSCVTQTRVSDSDMSNNEGNAWSATHSTVSQKGFFLSSGLSCSRDVFEFEWYIIMPSTLTAVHSNDCLFTAWLTADCF